MMDGSVEILTLGLGDEVFAVEAGLVREILDVVPVTVVPNSRPFVGGLINVRGRVVPLVDLRLKFGMAPRAHSIDTRIVVIEVSLDGDSTIVGILADKVHEVTSVSAAAMEEAPSIGMRWRSDFVRAIGKREHDFIIIVDIGRVLASGTNEASVFDAA